VAGFKDVNPAKSSSLWILKIEIQYISNVGRWKGTRFDRITCKVTEGGKI